MSGSWESRSWGTDWDDEDEVNASLLERVIVGVVAVTLIVLAAVAVGRVEPHSAACSAPTVQIAAP